MNPCSNNHIVKFLRFLWAHYFLFLNKQRGNKGQTVHETVGFRYKNSIFYKSQKQFLFSPEINFPPQTLSPSQGKRRKKPSTLSVARSKYDSPEKRSHNPKASPMATLGRLCRKEADCGIDVGPGQLQARPRHGQQLGAPGW